MMPHCQNFSTLMCVLLLNAASIQLQLRFTEYCVFTQKRERNCVYYCSSPFQTAEVALVWHIRLME